MITKNNTEQEFNKNVNAGEDVVELRDGDEAKVDLAELCLTRKVEPGNRDETDFFSGFNDSKKHKTNA